MWLEMLELEVANSPEGLHLWLLISGRFSKLKLGKHTKERAILKMRMSIPKFLRTIMFSQLCWLPQMHRNQVKNQTPLTQRKLTFIVKLNEK